MPVTLLYHTSPSAAPCRLIQERTARCPRQVRSVMACNGGLHSLVAAASLFARSLAAVSNKPVHVPQWDAACSCLATKAYNSHPIPGRLWANPVVFVVSADRRHRCLCTSVCKLFSTVAAVLSASSGRPCPSEAVVVWHSLPLSIIVVALFPSESPYCVAPG
jgi:hypothetical protein